MKDPRECKSWEEWTTSVATWFDLWSETARHMTDMQRVIDSQYAEIAALKDALEVLGFKYTRALRDLVADQLREGE